MFQNIISKLRPSTTRGGVVGLVISLSLLSIATAGAWRYQNGPDISKPANTPGVQDNGSGQVQGINDEQKSILTAEPATSDTDKNGTTTAIPAQNTSGNNSSGTGSQNLPTQPAAPVNQPSAVSVTLNINTESKGNVSVPAGGNHCDVLRQALADGLIGSLDMRYNSQHGSYGVYIIDGIGDPNSIWWGYKVNGKSPPYGCSKKIVAAGDSVLWEYVR